MRVFPTHLSSRFEKIIKNITTFLVPILGPIWLPYFPLWAPLFGCSIWLPYFLDALPKTVRPKGGGNGDFIDFPWYSVLGT